MPVPVDFSVPANLAAAFGLNSHDDASAFASSAFAVIASTLAQSSVARLAVWMPTVDSTPVGSFVPPPLDRKSTRLNSSHYCATRMPSSACKKKYSDISPHISSDKLHNKITCLNNT